MAFMNRKKQMEEQYRAAKPIAGAQRPAGSFAGQQTNSRYGATPQDMQGWNSDGTIGKTITRADMDIGNPNSRYGATSQDVTSSPGGMTGGWGATPQDAQQFSPHGGGQKDRYAGWNIVSIGKGGTPPGYTVGSLNDRGMTSMQDTNPGGQEPGQDYANMLPSPNPGGQEPGRISMQQPRMMGSTGSFPQQETSIFDSGMAQPNAGRGSLSMAQPRFGDGQIGMKQQYADDSTFNSGNIRDAMSYGSDTASSGDISGRASYGSNGLYNADEVASMMDQSGYFFSDADRRLAQKYPEFGIYAIQCKKEYAEATTPEAKALANANLEAMRKKLGSYTGGSDGSEYNPIPGDIDDRPRYDPTDLPDMPTWDPTGAGDMPEWGGAGSPAQPTWDPTNLPDRPEYDPSNLPDRPTYDPTKDGDMPTYDPSNLRDMPEYDPSNLPDRPEWDDAGNRAGVDDAIQKIRELDPYDDRYNDQIQSLLQQILGRGDFNYDYQTDPVWQSYKKQYTREGQRAQADALAQAAALTGGVPSSYANTAAQQAGNYYAAQMSDKIPELYQAAYDRWNAEGDRMLGNMNMLRGLANDDYGRYSDNYNRLMNNLDAERTLYNDAYGRHRDSVGDWERDRAFGYNQYLDQLGQWNNDRAFGYNQWRDQVGDWQNNRNFNYNQYLNQLGQWNTDRNFDYGRYLDELGQWNNDRSFDYGRYRDEVGDWRDNRNFDYDRYRDQVGDWRDNRNFDYDRYRDQVGDWRDSRNFGYDAYRDSTSDWQRQQDDEYDRRLQEAKLRASLGDYSGYDELYGTDGQLQALYDAMNAGSGYGGGYGGGNGSDTALPEPDNFQPLMPDQLGQGASDLLKSLQKSGYVQNGVVPDSMISQIEGAVNNGSITDEEAQTILYLIGAK